jgi:NAD kinase
MAGFERIIVVTRKTALEELIERFNTREQARFYIEHMGESFATYVESHDAYVKALADLRKALPRDVRSQIIERSFVPNFLFGEHDLVLTLGQDGLVVNVAKYLAAQPILAVNPDPQRIDGVLLPFAVTPGFGKIVERVLAGEFQRKQISMAKAAVNDGQSLYAVNDLFIGQKTHLSARYRIQLGTNAENQSSSGVIVSTGAGSTGWFRSVLTGAVGVVLGYRQEKDILAIRERYRYDWESNTLCFSVREPFVSKTTNADLVFGRIDDGQTLEITSQMPQNGVIFSDGIETDYVAFNSGAKVRVTLAERKVQFISGI